MSFYATVAGSDSNSARLNEILKLDDYETGRERDTYVRTFVNHPHVPADGTYIVLLTRNGGGNREYFESVFESLKSHPFYVADWDCDWDETYAEICFRIPGEHSEEVAAMTVSKDPGQKFDDFVQAMRPGYPF